MLDRLLHHGHVLKCVHAAGAQRPPPHPNKENRSLLRGLCPRAPGIYRFRARMQKGRPSRPALRPLCRRAPVTFLRCRILRTGVVSLQLLPRFRKQKFASRPLSRYNYSCPEPAPPLPGFQVITEAKRGRDLFLGPAILGSFSQPQKPCAQSNCFVSSSLISPSSIAELCPELPDSAHENSSDRTATLLSIGLLLSLILYGFFERQSALRPVLAKLNA